MSLTDEARRQSGRSRLCKRCSFGGLCNPKVLEICNLSFIDGFKKGYKFGKSKK